MASGLLIDYLGSGPIADRPVAPTLFAGSLGLWYATDVGAEQLSAWDGTVWADVVGGGGGGAVASVNGQTGAVVLDAGDVGAATTAQGATADTAVQPGDLAAIATSGALLDATDFPGGTTDFLRADGSFATPSGGGGGLTGFTSALNTTSPNNTNNVSSLAASGGTTNQYAALIPKGNGGVLAAIPDGTTAGGNVRGINSVDWQTNRANANQVAGGQSAVIAGGRNNLTSSNFSTVSGGDGCSATAIGAVVGGGEANVSAGTYSSVGGGRSNSTGTSGDTTIAGGRLNTVGNSGGANTIGGGQSNAISASVNQSTISGGISNSITAGPDSAITGGNGNVLSGAGSRAGGVQSADRGIAGSDVYANGRFGVTGDAQTRTIVLRSDTTSATPEAMTSTNSAASTNNQVILPNNSAYTVDGTITARESGGNARSWKVEAFLVRGANAAATTLVAGAAPTIIGTSGGFTGTLAITADTTNGGMAITVTGVAATNIKWVATLRCSEVVG